jgi:hypothetical protein
MFLAMNFFAAAAGAILILLLVDQPSERLRAAWVRRRLRSVSGIAGANLPKSIQSGQSMGQSTIS